MGKNHRHKKILKSERGKVKLRVKTEKTKFLPKGLNVTRTDFKVKSIIIPEQLKEKDAADVLSERKLTVKDILSRLRHHNSTIRQNALVDMKQLLHSHFDAIITNHLAQLMQGLPPLILDENPTIRTIVMSIVQKILEMVDTGKLVPFYGTLSSYLRCAMTNINRTIQEDSLRFLALLLQFVPQMISDEKQKVLPNLFSLISRLRTESKPTRTLSVNLNTKLTSVKWHIKVLTGIYGVLKAMNMNCNNFPSKTPSLLALSANKKASKYAPVFHNNYIKNKRDFHLNTASTLHNQQYDVIEKNLSPLITLLYEIWIEVAPEKDLQVRNNFLQLQHDAAAVLSCILNVLHMLYIQVLQNHKDKDIAHVRDLFCTSDYKNFVQNVLTQFPFAQVQEKVAKNEQTTVQRVLQQHFVQDTHFARENLLICYMFCNLEKHLVRKSVIADANMILKFIEHCLITRGYITNTNIDCLLLVVKTLFFDNIEWYSKVNIENILIRFVSFYNQFKTTHGEGRNEKTNEILDVLCDCSQLSHLNRNQVYQTWLNNISAALEERNVTEKIVDALLLVAKQSNVEFLIGLQMRLKQIVENYKTIKVVRNFNDNNDKCADNVSKLKILCLFFYLPEINAADVCVLKQFLLDCANCEELQQERNIVEQLLRKFDIE